MMGSKICLNLSLMKKCRQLRLRNLNRSKNRSKNIIRRKSLLRRSLRRRRRRVMISLRNTLSIRFIKKKKSRLSRLSFQKEAVLCGLNQTNQCYLKSFLPYGMTRVWKPEILSIADLLTALNLVSKFQTNLEYWFQACLGSNNGRKSIIHWFKSSMGTT